MIKLKRVIAAFIICTSFTSVSCSRVKTESEALQNEISASEKSGGITENSGGETLEAYDGRGKGFTDGSYKPTSFSWSGGSGKVSICCDEVMVFGGEAVATITFSSPNYEYVRVGDEKFEGEYTEDTSTFKVPVQLDEDNEIIGCTTAMSRPHEVTYTIFVSVDDEAVTNEIQSQTKTENRDEELREKVKATADVGADNWSEIPEIPGLTYDHEMKLEYARCFAVYYYKDGYKIVDVIDGNSYLLVPEGKSIPEGLAKNITVIKQPVQNIYLAATGAMSLFDAIHQIDSIKYTGTDVTGWDIDAPKEAIKSGKMSFAGKYSAPDYEMLIAGNCNLAIESTMILHNPEAKEQLQAVGIPVFTDWSSYEKTAMGRTEWARLYAAILDEEAEAETFIQREKAESRIDEGFPETGKSVAFFYINTKGLAVVRAEDDYISRMIRDGGGNNAFDSVALRDDGGTTVEISVEEFYSAAAEADYLIYNGTIDTSVKNVEDMVEKNQLLSSFKAVEEGNVYLVDKKFYQSTDKASEFARDVSRMLGGSGEDMTFLEKIN